MSASLDKDEISAALAPATREWLGELEVLDVVPSTNTWLMQQERHEPGRCHVVLAEHQTAGRGRQSRRWYSPPRAGLCLSLAYTFGENPGNISCMTLAAGVAVVQALAELGCREPRLKWPNDIYAGDAKLGGILTDAQTAPGGRITMICGVGLNVDLAAADTGTADLDKLDYSVTDLKSHVDELPSRSALAAAVIDRLALAFRKFEEAGLEPFRNDWNRHDWLRGREISVDMPDGQLSGTADGIDANGALRVNTVHGRRRVYTGDVRVRAAVRA